MTSDRCAEFFDGFGLHWHVSASTRRTVKLHPSVAERVIEGLAEMNPYTQAVYLRGMRGEEMVYLNYIAPEDVDEEEDRELHGFGQVVGEVQDTLVAWAEGGWAVLGM